MTRPCIWVLALAVCAFGDAIATQPALPGITGDVKTHERFASKFVSPRNVYVWLPASYAKDGARRYPVVYMHDGQNLYDPKTSFIGVDWGVDEAMTNGIRDGRINEAIIVGIANTPLRIGEYVPEEMIRSEKSDEKRAEILATLSKWQPGLDEPGLLSDEYLKFVVQELKPFVDKTYRTTPDRDHTHIMGSSAGALISLYAICEYPDIFGGAGCVSTHWPIGDGLMIEYIRDKLPDPKTHKIYFDFGTVTLDAEYEPYQQKMDVVMQARGYEKDVNWMTRKFEGAEHSERAWRSRVQIPLQFLLGSP